MSTKRTIEDCLRLDIATFTEHGIFRSEPGTTGVLYLPRRENLSLLIYELVEPSPRQLGLRLEYPASSPASGWSLLDYVIELEAVPCHFGGSRWHFRCPGGGCRHRRLTLYLPQETRKFSCRSCHELSYGSQNRRDKVYLEYERPQNQLKRIRGRLNRARSDEERKQLAAQAAALERGLNDFKTWVKKVGWRISFGPPVAAWERRAYERAHGLWSSEEESERRDRLSYRVGSVFTPDQLLKGA